MTKMEKIFVGLGVGTTALLALGFGMVAMHGPYNGDTSKTASAPGSPAQTQGAFTSTATTNASTVTAAANTTSAPAQLDPLPANAPNIPDKYLEQLSLHVDLASSPKQSPNKDQWREALPAAEKLMAGPCDCAQKVWLKHYIEMGNFALTDANRQYHETAALIVTLGRNDQQAMTIKRN